jgi:hypothetical protein
MENSLFRLNREKNSREIRIVIEGNEDLSFNET